MASKASKSILPIAIVGGLGYLAYQASQAKAAVKKLKLVGAKVLKVDFAKLTSIDIKVQLLLDNPSNTNIPFEYFNGSVMNAGTKLADFSFNGNGKNIVIAALKQTPVDFTLNIGSLTVVAKLVALVSNLGSGEKADSVLKFAGSVFAGGIEIPANFTYDIAPGAINGIGEIGKFKFFNAAKKFIRHSALGPLALAQDLIKKRRQRKKRGGDTASPAPAQYNNQSYNSYQGSPEKQAMRMQWRAWHRQKVNEYKAWLPSQPGYVPGKAVPSNLWFHTWIKTQPQFVPGQQYTMPVSTTATLVPPPAAPYGLPTN